MSPDDLQQITDAIYYVAHCVKVIGISLIVVMGYLAVIYFAHRK